MKFAKFLRTPILKCMCERLLLFVSLQKKINSIVQFARIHTSSLIKIEKILNRPITKFCNSDDVNVIAGELRLTKTRLASLYLYGLL